MNQNRKQTQRAGGLDYIGDYFVNNTFAKLGWYTLWSQMRQCPEPFRANKIGISPYPTYDERQDAPCSHATLDTHTLATFSGGESDVAVHHQVSWSPSSRYPYHLTSVCSIPIFCVSLGKVDSFSFGNLCPSFFASRTGPMISSFS